MLSVDQKKVKFDCFEVPSVPDKGADAHDCTQVYSGILTAERTAVTMAPSMCVSRALSGKLLVTVSM